MLVLPPLSLYIHIPWCVRKCPYCDFNSHARSQPLPERAYVAALLADLAQDLPLAHGRPLQSIFFGGGTPSLFSAGAIADILAGATQHLSLAPDCEITLETNPGTAEYDRFEGYRQAGVNRLSFGVQSFDDGCLTRLGRIHDAAQAERAIKQAQQAGYRNINLDLMYALPGQTLAMAERDIEWALALAPTHLSHYQLTLEPNTVFAARPPAGLPDDDLAFEMQTHCQAQLATAGFVQYEISAYAQAGYRCMHNLNYWQFGDYLGIGTGAHGKLTDAGSGRILRRWKQRHPREYLATAATPKRVGGDEWIPHERLPFEFMLNALRLPEGFARPTFEACTGLPYASIADQIEKAVRAGWLRMAGEMVYPTEWGLRFNNDLLALFLPESG